MTGTSTAVLVDTNVLVYAYDPADPPKQVQAQAVLAALASKGGVLSVQVLGEFYVAVTRHVRPLLTADRAAESVENYLASWPVHALTPDIQRQALRGVRRYQLPYWDALIWATAVANGAATVLSEDFSDGQVLDGVRFCNPFTSSFEVAPLLGGTAPTEPEAKPPTTERAD